MNPAWFMFLVFVVCLLLCVPIAVSLGASVVATMLVYPKVVTATMIPLTFFSSCDSFPLLAIPFFILSGDLMLEGGISQRLVSFALAVFGHLRGALAVVLIICCAFFSALSGSGPATTAAIGSILVPEMKKENYPAEFSSSLASCAGSMGPVIPPSIFFIFYGVANNVSISKLFVAGIVPGLVMAACLIFYVEVACRKHKLGVMHQRASAESIRAAFKDSIWALLSPVIILGGIYAGIFTPTEAAVVACVYSLLVGIFIYRGIRSFKQFFRVVTNSVNTTGLCLIIMGTAYVFGRVLTLERVPMNIANWIGTLTNQLWLVLILINVFLLIVGCFMDIVASNLILSPILLPIVRALGMDPIHFGCVMCVNLVIGLATPPVGTNTYVACRIGQVPMSGMFRWLYPMIGSLIVALLLVTYIPRLSLFLPGFMK